MNPSSHRKRLTNASLRFERLEDRRVLAGAGVELPLVPPVTTHGEQLGDLASHVVEQAHSQAAALLGQVAATASKAFPDVDGKDGVTSFDALLVINDLNRHGTRLLGAHEAADWSLDVDKDGWVTPFDALTVVNAVNYQLRQLKSSAAVTPSDETGVSPTLASLQTQNADSTVQCLNEQTELITKVYPVADLVIPRHGQHGGLHGGLHGGPLGGLLGELGGGFVGGLLDGIADGLHGGLANGFGGGFGGGGFGGGGLQWGEMDPGGTYDGGYGGGMNGGSTADFDTLINLITTTIERETWDELGGDGTIQENPQSLSLVISQTQAVHQEIADLLNQLRRLQDLQITIEVRFVTLNDNFFERIGVDFDFDINDPTLPLPAEQDFAEGAPGVNEVAGFTQSFNRRTIPDLNFNQNSFDILPLFGGGDVDPGANFGFAILSDIEVFFLLQASQGDDRSDVTEAPKVTLFDGQTATIFSGTQRPFVTSITPVVG